MARLAVAVNPQIENNPAWEPLLKAVRVADVSWRNSGREFKFKDSLTSFLRNFPPILHPVVALALSVAKWYLIVQGEDILRTCAANCGCCQHFTFCVGCPLDKTPGVECVSHDVHATYSHILKIYTKHFAALPDRDKQRLAA